MDNYELVVGTKDCPLNTIIKIVRQSSAIQNDWSTFARELDVSSERIKKFRQDLLLDKIGYADLLVEVLEIWIAKKSSDATLANLLQVVEGDCGANDVGEKLRLEFKVLPQETDPNQSENKPHVLTTGLPDQLTYYVSRTIVVPTNIISDQIFDQDSSDIFLFTGMNRYELSKLAKDKLTGNSRQQLQSGVNSKFMILDQEHHFKKICEMTDHPVHVLRREGDQRLRWVKSNGGMNILRRFREQDELNEEQFCQMCTSKSIPVLICDTPGMGKSVLLTQIGHRLVQLHPDRTVCFIVLSNFIEYAKSLKIEDKLKVVELTLQNWTGEVLRLSKLDSEEETISTELLLDGYDEVDLADRKLALEILQTISKSFECIRLWITSRPHLMAELEVNLNILGYNIRPFTKENQVHFLSSFWSLGRQLDQEKLKLFAKTCLKSLKSTMNSTDNDIAGIPLQCILIAEVYEDGAVEYAKIEEGNVTSAPPEIVIGTITNLYRKLIQKKFEKYACAYGNATLSEDDMMTTHAHLSLQLLFPVEHRVLRLITADEVDLDEVMKGGILTSTQTGAVTFMHRTFAEYFTAWFILCNLQQTTKWEPEMTNLFFTILSCFEHRIYREYYGDKYEMTFSYPVICYFLNSMIGSFQVEIFSYNLPSNLIGKQLKYVKNIVYACIDGNYVQIFKLFDTFGTFDMLTGKFAKIFKSIVPSDKFTTLSGNFFNVELLLRAVRDSNVEIVKLVLASFERYNSFDLKTQKATLREAVKYGRFSILEFLIKKKRLNGIVENFDKKTNLVCDCVEETTWASDEEIKERILVVQMLVGIKGSLVDGLNGSSSTVPLLSKYAHVKLLKELVRLGANVVVQRDGGETVLHLTRSFVPSHTSPVDYHDLLLSIPTENLKKIFKLKVPLRNRDTALTSILREFDPLPETLDIFHVVGADFNGVDEDGYSALAVAITSGRNAGTIRKLIQVGADVNGRDRFGNTLLHIVAKSYRGSRCTIVQTLLENGSNPTALNNLKETPFHVFLENKYRYDFKIFQLFKSVWDERCLWTPTISSLALGYAVGGDDACPDQDFEPLARECETHGANFNWKDVDGNSLLHMAAFNGKATRVLYLIEKGVDVNSKNEGGESPLHRAAESGENTSLEVIKCLIENGANPMEITNDRCNILHFAAYGTTEALKYCLGLGGVDVNGKDVNGDTPLHYIVDYRNKLAEINCLERCKLLIQYGADVNIRNRLGRTPMQMARKGDPGYKALKELLHLSSMNI